MKKILTLLGTFGLITTTSAIVLACSSKTSQDSSNKNPEFKEESKLILNKKPKKEITDLVENILTDNLDMNKIPEEIIKNKSAISKEFTDLLDEIYMKNNKNIEQTLNDFSEELVDFLAPLIVGDVLKTRPELKQNDDGSGEKFVWTLETEVNNMKKDIVGVIFDGSLDKNSSNEINELYNGDESEEMINQLVKEYKDKLANYKESFKTKNKDNLEKLKSLLSKLS
ncbi:lipoprotein [Mycoplasma feriruminatoris]|uniref:lipoprotein n=1 Tax=Mycoplasma feriruminatoris TaxID=1179777 RepID=UPI00241FF563|nr:lipoprotein [Mycoplasma feriruminatoris]WFQ95949.1 lipoprotein [Mycoplasma feriruminatoris]